MNAPTTALTQTPQAALWLLVLITLSGTLAMHMFVPALPAAAHSLGASKAAIQSTISVYIMGLAFGQLFYGPLSDALGRRPMLLVGLALYAVAGLVAAMATNLHVLVGARLFQALGGCAGLTLGRAIVRDTAAPTEAVRSLALLNVIMMVGPGLAPIIGALLVSVAGWRSVFVVLLTMGCLTWWLTWRLVPETSHPSGKLSIKLLANDYGALLRSPYFVAYAIGGGCATTGVYAFIAGAPFIFINQLHRPVGEVGLYLGIAVTGMALGNGITRSWVARLGVAKLLLLGNVASMSSAAGLLAVVALGDLTAPVFTLLVFIFATGAGTCSPAVLSKVLAVDSSLIGSAAGLYGFTQMAIGAVCTTLAGIGANPALTVSTALLGAGVLAQAGFSAGRFFEKRAP